MTAIKLQKIMLMFLLGLVLSACGYSDPFYGQGSGLNFARFPLIKPYYAMSIINKPDAKWIIPLETEPPLKELTYLPEISGVQKIAVFENVIMVYAPDNYGYSLSKGKKDENIFDWFILIPDEHLEIGFTTEAEFLDYIHWNKLGEPKWLEPVVILQKYDRIGGCLDWIPDCK